MICCGCHGNNITLPLGCLHYAFLLSIKCMSIASHSTYTFCPDPIHTYSVTICEHAVQGFGHHCQCMCVYRSALKQSVITPPPIICPVLDASVSLCISFPTPISRPCWCRHSCHHWGGGGRCHSDPRLYLVCLLCCIGLCEMQQNK